MGPKHKYHPKRHQATGKSSINELSSSSQFIGRAIEGLPIIRWEEGKDSKIPEIAETLKSYFGRTTDLQPYRGIFDEQTKTYDDFAPVRPRRPDTGEEALESGTKPTDAQLFEEEVFKETVKKVAKLTVAFNSNRSMAYSTIFCQLSKESLDRLRKLSMNFAEVERMEDPLELWLSIKRTHIIGKTGIEELDLIDAENKFNNVKMMEGESCQNFKERLKRANDELSKPKGEGLLGIMFIKRLHPGRFKELQVEIANACYKEDGTMVNAYPVTLEAAHWKASHYVRSTESSKISGGELKANLAKATNGDEAKGGDGKKSKGKKGKPKQKAEPKEAEEDESSDDKDQDRTSKLECWACGGNHTLMKCDQYKDILNDLKDQGKLPYRKKGFLALTPSVILEEGRLFAGHFLCRARGDEVFTPWTVILDNGANVLVVHNKKLLHEITEVPEAAIGGVAKGAEAMSYRIGKFVDLGYAYYSEHVEANLLSYGYCADNHQVEYDSSEDVFTVITESNTYEFRRNGGLYTREFTPESLTDLRTKMHAYVTTVAERERMYTKREVHQAKLARELMKRLAYISQADLVRFLANGRVLDCPVTVADVHRAHAIYGPDIATMKGKTKTQKSKPVRVEPVPVPLHKNQVLHVDIFFVDKTPYLLAVSLPLGFISVQWLRGRRSHPNIRKAMHRVIGILKAESFVVSHVLTDSEKGVISMETELNQMGINVNPAGTGDHVPVIENMTRQVKERSRCFACTLPYKLTAMLYMWLIFFVVSRKNMVPSKDSDGPSPWECLKGRKPSFKRDLRVSFGEFCQTTNPNMTNEVDVTRTEDAIALCPIGNIEGTVSFLSLANWEVIRRSKFEILPMPNSVIQRINEKADAERAKTKRDPKDSVWRYRDAVLDGNPDDEHVVFDEPDYTIAVGVGDGLEPDEPPDAEIVEEPAAVEEAAIEVADTGEVVTTGVSHDVDDSVGNNQIADDYAQEPVQSLGGAEEPVAQPSTPSPTKRSRATSSSKAKSTAGSNSEDPQRPPDVSDTGRPMRSTRSAYSWKDGDHRNRKFYQHDDAFRTAKKSYHIRLKKAIASRGRAAIKAMVLEVLQMVEKEVLHPISIKKLSLKQMKKILRSSMFLKEKFNSSGEFQKLKARLVAGGDGQDKSLYPVEDITSPTADASSVFMIAHIAAHEGRHVGSGDVTGAYLNADMKAEVHMKLPKIIAQILVSIMPEYKTFLLPSGEIVVQLDKALYGCVESARLWYEHLAMSMERLGFTRNPLDICVFNKIDEYGKQCTVIVHVDDFLVTCATKETVKKFLVEIKEIYKEVNTVFGTLHSFLGMTLDFSEPRKVNITMAKYVDDCLVEAKVEGIAATPAAANLFDIGAHDTPKLDKQRHKLFHSRVYKLLYLARKTRPDMLTAVVFLTTRTQAPNELDWTKLTRVYKYLNGTRDLGIVLQSINRLVVSAWIDASFGVHPEMKSHTGSVISLGKGPIYVKSSKQKLNSLASTESELIGLSDECRQVIWTRNFLLHQGYDIGPAVIKQDNQSTIALAQKGRSTSNRTRHIAIRYFFIKDRIDCGEIRLEYCPTDEMIADVLTKPLQGEAFRKLRSELLNL